MSDTGTYQAYAALEGQPPLVRRQRRLEKVVAQVTKADIDAEKACRAAIDALLVKAGLATGDAVTCNGYDVTHNERKGHRSLDQTKLVAELVAKGVKAELVTAALETATDTGDPVKFASIKPSKGAQVRNR